MKKALGLALTALCLAGMWLDVNRVVIAHQIADALQWQMPRGNLSDLYPRWLGTRELLLHRRDPYSRDVTEEIQAGYYGRVLDPSRPQDPTDQQAFVYPVYTVFLLAPTVMLPFPTVQAAFFWLLAVFTSLSVILWLRFLRWQVGWFEVAVLLLLTMGSFAAVQGLKLQQLSLVVAFLLAGALACISGERFVGAGVLLALATIKPQLSLPLILWLLLWAFSKWKERRNLVLTVLVCITMLIGGGELLLPGWISQFYAAMIAYRGYTPAGSLFEKILSPAIAIPLIIALALSLVLVCWQTRKSGPRDSGFIHTTALVLGTTLLLIPMMPPYNQVLLLPSIFLLVRHWRELWGRGIAGKILLASVAVPLGWSWASAIVLAGASFFTPAAQNFWQLPLWTSIVLPIPVVACLGLLTRKRPVPEG